MYCFSIIAMVNKIKIKNKKKNNLQREKWRRSLWCILPVTNQTSFRLYMTLKQTLRRTPTDIMQACRKLSYTITDTAVHCEGNSFWCGSVFCVPPVLFFWTATISPSIHPAAWGCFPFPSVLSRPGPSPSWSVCVSSALLPWYVEIPPWPRCQPPWLSVAALVCASPL